MLLTKITRPPVAQLGDAEHAAPEDAHGAQRQRREEALEHPRLPDRHQLRVLVQSRGAESSMSSEDVDEEVAAEDHEGE